MQVGRREFVNGEVDVIAFFRGVWSPTSDGGGLNVPQDLQVDSWRDNKDL